MISFTTMIKLFKRFIEKRRRKQILKDIIKAKEYYVNRDFFSMRFCFYAVDNNYLAFGVDYFIPEFNREFLGATTNASASIWWSILDRQSRLKAFDKLIEVYSK